MIERTHASIYHGETCAAGISVPMLSIEHTADDAVPQPHTHRIHTASASRDKTMVAIQGANHYFVGQPALLDQAVKLCTVWMRDRHLA